MRGKLGGERGVAQRGRRLGAGVDADVDDERSGGGTRMSVETTFPSIEVMDQMVQMGMEEGMVGAMGQIDPILAEG